MMDEWTREAVEHIRATAQPPQAPEEMILSMGETRTGDEHTAADDAQWQRAKSEGDNVLARCHPAMTRATITIVGGNHCVGVWYCPTCGLVSQGEGKG